LKGELQVVASALVLEAEQTVPELRNGIQKHIRAHPELADNPRFTPLFAHRPEAKLAGKNRAKKLMKKRPANRTLHEQQVKTDPPAQLSRLTLHDTKRVPETEGINDDDDSDSNSGSVGSRSDSPSPVPEQRKEKLNVKKQPTREVVRANLPEVVRVNFFDANDPMAEPRQVPVLGKEIPISASTAEHGSTQDMSKLSELLPVAFQNDSPIKDRGGRIYRPDIRGQGHNHIGKIDTILEGDLNTYTLRTASSGDFPPVTNAVSGAPGQILPVPAVNVPNVEPSPIVPNPTGKIAAPGVRDQFLRFLHSELAANIPGVPEFGAAWPRAKFAGTLLERHLIEEKVLEFFTAWSRTIGGYTVPQGYREYAGISFTKGEVLDAINIKSSRSNNTSNVFTPDNLKHSLKAKAWYASGGNTHKDYFSKMTTAKFKKHLEERRGDHNHGSSSGKARARVRRRSPSASESDARSRKHKRSTSLSGDESEEQRKRSKSSKKRVSKSVTSETLDSP
ncbi:hypothetical protein C8R45DRAFT_971684, partial [Mycena sanguinolenta]